jgi:hypothetical protein
MQKQSLVQRLVNYPQNDLLDKQLVQELKNYCKQSQDNVRKVVDGLYRQLKRQHSQVRYLCLLILEDFFPRSEYFRQQVLAKAKVLLQLAVGDAEHPLPEPLKWQLKTREKAQDLVKRWKAEFVSVHSELVSISSLLEQQIANSTPLLMEDANNSIDIQRNKAANELRLKKFLEILETEYPSRRNRIHEYLTQIENCILLIIPNYANSISGISVGPVDNSIPSSAIGTRSYAIEVQLGTMELFETPENTDIYDNLRENLKLLEDSVKIVEEWLSLVTKVDDEQEHRRNNFLKELISLKEKLLDATTKANEILVKTISKLEDDDGDFEDVDDEDYHIYSNEPKTVQKPGNPLEIRKSGTAGMKPVFRFTELNLDAESLESKIETNSKKGKFKDPQLQELFKIAPVVPFDEDLHFWSKEDILFNEVSANAGVDFHHRFLGDGPSDKKLSKEAVDGLKKRVVYLDELEKPREYTACRAPLKNGGLCSRKDMFNCPFHGPKVPRDEFGYPLTSSDSIPSRMSSQPAVWEVIENQINSTHGLTPAGKKTRLDVIEKPQPSVRTRILRKNEKRAKHKSSINDPTADYDYRDRNAFRW